MIETLIDGNYDLCAELSKDLKCLDHEKFDALLKAKDRTRLIRLITEAQTITSIPPSMQETLTKGVNTVMGRFCDLAFVYYRTHDFPETPKVIEVMRYVVANYYGVQKFV